jgi:hypothetical protein
MLEARMHSAKEFDCFGVTWVGIAADKRLAPIMTKITMGGDEWCPNFFSVDFSETDELPHLNYFRRSIELIRPFDASIHPTMHHYELIERLPRPLLPSRDSIPKIIYWFHYLDGEITAKLGGLAYCLETPAFKCERFLDGVLIQLTQEPFNPTNDFHIEVQLRAMKHLGVACAYV